MHRITAILTLILTSAALPQHVPVSLPQPTSAASAATEALLRTLASQAAVIFTGEVLTVTPSDGFSTAGFIDIRFHIDQCIQGCASTSYTLREWSGLWSSQPNRYLPGQRLLLFLTARSSSGFSAPVGVNDGIIPLHATTAPPILDATGAPPPDTNPTPPAWTADLSHLQATAPRASNPATSTLLTSQTATPTDWSGPTAVLPTSTPTPLTTILNLLTGATHAPR